SMIAGAPERSGAVSVRDDIGPITVRGSLIGNASYPVVISARGQASPTATTDVAIKSLTVFGNVDHVAIVAGYDPDIQATNADAQVGEVCVGGNWTASNLAVGVGSAGDGRFGTADDARLAGAGQHDSTPIAMIAAVIIGGQVLGDAGTNNTSGFGAEQI